MTFDKNSPKPGVNDDMVISLLRKNVEIQTYFKHTGHLLPNQLDGNLRIEVDCSSLAYFDWLTNVNQVCGIITSIAIDKALFLV